MELREAHQFDSFLLEAIDEVLRCCLGDYNTEIVYSYLEKRACPISEVPQRIEVFSSELRELLGFGRGSIVGSAAILEDTIVEVLCSKLHPKIGESTVHGPFFDCVTRLREAYYAENDQSK